VTFRLYWVSPKHYLLFNQPTIDLTRPANYTNYGRQTFFAIFLVRFRNFMDLLRLSHATSQASTPPQLQTLPPLIFAQSTFRGSERARPTANLPSTSFHSGVSFLFLQQLVHLSCAMIVYHRFISCLTVLLKLKPDSQKIILESKSSQSTNW